MDVSEVNSSSGSAAVQPLRWALLALLAMFASLSICCDGGKRGKTDTPNQAAEAARKSETKTYVHDASGGSISIPADLEVGKATPDEWSFARGERNKPMVIVGLQWCAGTTSGKAAEVRRLLRARGDPTAKFGNTPEKIGELYGFRYREQGDPTGNSAAVHYVIDLGEKGGKRHCLHATVIAENMTGDELEKSLQWGDEVMSTVRAGTAGK